MNKPRKLRSTYYLIILVILSLSCENEKENLTNSHSYPIASDLEWGKYSVGFMSSNEMVSANNELPNIEDVRQVDFGIWYPAKRSNKKSMQYLDYLKTFDTKSEDSIRYLYSHQQSFLGQLDSSVLANNLSIQTNAVHMAEPVKEKYPLIIYIGRANDLVYGNSFLFEFLSSQGYVILSLPPKTPKSKNDSMVRTNLNDLKTVISYLKSNYNYIDYSKIATIAYEIGGVSAIALTMEDSSIRAHISMQGAIGSFFGLSFLQPIPDINIKEFKAPVLHFGSPGYEKEPKQIAGESYFETADSIPFSKKYFSYLDRTVPLGVSSHLVLSWVNPLVGVKEGYQVDKDGVKKCYSEMLVHTLMFVDFYLKEKGDEKQLNKLIMSNHQRNFIKF